jgi:hypothetical protein
MLSHKSKIFLNYIPARLEHSWFIDKFLEKLIK